jgi:hypothetical protein
MPRTQDNTVYESGVVYQSRDYDQFTFMEANRDQNRGHIEALKRAFAEIGNLTEVQPILVNENFEIIDGQHRFVAARELEEPIYFVIRPGLRVTDARTMNILHRNWTIDDYARSYATTDPNYQKYLELREDYGFSHTITLSFSLGDETPGMHATFRKGEFTLPDLPAARARLDKLSDIVEILPRLRRDNAFARAFLKVLQTPSYDHDRMVRKVTQVGEMILRKYGSFAEYQRALEETYNYNMSESNRVRLYY